MIEVRLIDANENPIRTATLEQNLDGFRFLKITADDLRAAGRQLKIRLDLPLIDMHGGWNPEMTRPGSDLKWIYHFRAADNRNFPFQIFFREDQTNSAAIALTCIHDDTEVFAKINQEFSVYEISFDIAVVTGTEPFNLLFSDEKKPWTELVADYRAILIPDFRPDYPDAAWDPVYCTWYAVHAALTMDYLDSNTELAAQYGFGTFIVDDGWSYDESKRVTPERLTCWYQDIGNWTVSDAKLPGFRAHIKRAQAMGLKYMVWVAPFFLGPHAAEYRALKSPETELLSAELPSHAILDPAAKQPANDVMRRLFRLMDDLDLDGLKIDFIDWAIAELARPRGRDMKDWLERLIGGIRAKRPEALFEFRQKYATPSMLKLGTQFRAGDVPFDFLENLHRIAQIRICLGDGVPAHADPVYFHEQELDVNVSRHLIASLAGVPMFSMDLRKLTPSQSAILKHWLGFYRDHLSTYRTGHWEVSYCFDHLDTLSVTHGSERITILLGRDVPAFAGMHHVLNLSPVPLTVADAEAYDVEGNRLPGHTAPCGGRLAVRG